MGLFGRKNKKVDDGEVAELVTSSSVQDIQFEQPFIYDSTSRTFDVEMEMSFLVDNPNESGYINEMDQQIRYGLMVSNGYNPHTDSLLDLGCGRGQLYSYISSYFGVLPHDYVGIDMNADLVVDGNARLSEIYGESLSGQLEHGEMLSYVRDGEDQYDWIVACNVMSEVHAVASDESQIVMTQIAYLQAFITAVGQNARKGFVIDFHCDPNGLNVKIGERHWSWDASTLVSLFNSQFAGRYVMRHDYSSNNITFIVFNDR